VIEAAWWGATFPYLTPEDRKMIAQEAQKRVKTAAKRSRAAPPKGVIDMKTGMERKAIRAARRALYDGLIGLGIEGAFDACTAAQIDGLRCPTGIARSQAIWDALRASMQQQSAAGEIPI